MVKHGKDRKRRAGRIGKTKLKVSEKSKSFLPKDLVVVPAHGSLLALSCSILIDDRPF